MSSQPSEPVTYANDPEGATPAMMVDVRDVTRTYGSGPTAAPALRGVTFAIGQGRLVAGKL